ncbi:MAG: FRG domain-containing protein [Bacteroidetes bacterium]|nr:FRG domain-containing protein [Bacteroidota bacterium]
MIRTSVIEKFDNIIKIGTTLKENWYRGHSSIIEELTPGIYRKPYSNKIYQEFRSDIEFQYAEDFKRKAPSISTNLPEIDNHIEWLFLMQHHGVPTRLLDWTENILVATFFAVESDLDKDAELWTFLPWKLNEQHGFYGLPSNSKNKTLQFLSHEIFHSNPEKLKEEFGLSETPKAPMAFLPPLLHPRISVQQSCFTIHPNPQKGYSITEIITDSKFLMRYIIPKELKKTFRRNLNNLGITYRTLFPDLDGLAKSLKDKEDIIAWGQPDALIFKEYK